MRFILASASPRRRELLKKLIDFFEVQPSQAEEKLSIDDPAQLARALASAKCLDVAQRNPGAAVIGADTVVAFGGRILGKPKDRNDARDTLRLLSGRTHQVYTGVCVVAGGSVRSGVECSEVTFYPLTEAAIEAYLDTGSPMDKAGSYGIQDGFGIVESYRGDYGNIVGLPAALTARLLREAGCPTD